jgi:hypothetical protein
MPVAVVWSTRGPNSTAAKYDQLIQDMNASPGGPHPGVGCLFHWVRVDNDGLHGVDVWDTREHFNDFAQNELGPKATALGMSMPQTTFHDTHNFLTAH